MDKKRAATLRPKMLNRGHFTLIDSGVHAYE